MLVHIISKKDGLFDVELIDSCSGGNKRHIKTYYDVEKIMYNGHKVRGLDGEVFLEAIEITYDEEKNTMFVNDLLGITITLDTLLKQLEEIKHLIGSKED